MNIDNGRPDDPDYPKAEPPATAFNPDGTEVIVHVGNYVVNRDGDIVIATTSNAGEWPNDFIASLNRGYFRAKYIGNRDDYLEFANQCRLATPEEIERAKISPPLRTIYFLHFKTCYNDNPGLLHHRSLAALTRNQESPLCYPTNHPHENHCYK
jgi:hypothetical protein